MGKCILLLSSVLIMGGCVTRGKDFSTDITWIKKDVTKKTDVRTMLGEPFQVGFASGKPTWTYGLYKHTLFGSSNTKELKLYWNPDGSVGNYSFSSSFPDDVKRGVIQQKYAPVDDL